MNSFDKKKKMVRIVQEACRYRGVVDLSLRLKGIRILHLILIQLTTTTVSRD